jgi:4'-phosphopantetheinyl transferase
MIEKDLITINYATYSQDFEEFPHYNYTERLPEIIKTYCRRFVHWQDRQSCLIGKILLLKWLEKCGFASELISTWHKDEYGKPHLRNNVSFNISHSDGCVVCAVSKNKVPLGIDIEKIKPINANDFNLIFSETIIKEINNSQEPYIQFYRYWTAAESALKADGRGFSIDTDKVMVDLSSNTVRIENCVWHLTPIDVGDNRVCYLSSSISIENLRLDFNHYNFSN